MSDPTDFTRKEPTQERARQTLEYIFEATAQLLDTESADKLNTNRIAERAGVSIGTIYTYFPNKASLVKAMALREVERFETHFNEQIDAARGEDPAEILRALVRQGPFGGRQRVRRHMLALVGTDSAVQNAVHQAVDRMTARLISGLGFGPEDLSSERRYLLLRSALGPIRAATCHAPERVTSPDFEEELVGMVLKLLGR